MGSQGHYSIKELLSLRSRAKLPEGPLAFTNDVKSYFRLFNRINRLSNEALLPKLEKAVANSRTVWRYSPWIPNKEFKREWVKTHDTTVGLSDLPRHPFKMLSAVVYTIAEKRTRLVLRLCRVLDRKRINLWGKPPQAEFPRKLPTRVPPVGPLPEGARTTYPRYRCLKWSKGGSTRPMKKDRNPSIIPSGSIYQRGHDTYLSYAGGQTRVYNDPIVSEDPQANKRLAYYYRKNRVVYNSVHNPVHTGISPEAIFRFR
jgi:hypothetical protein